jgi:hypothetical protein
MIMANVKKIYKKSLFTLNWRLLYGTGLNRLFHARNVAESGRRCQVRLSTRFEGDQGADETAS